VLATFAAISPQGDLFHDTDSVLITESIVDFRTSFGPCASIQTNGTIIYDKVSMSLGRNSVTPNTPIGTLQPYIFYVDSQIQEKIAQYLFLIPGTYTYLTLSLGENYTDSDYFGFYLNIYLTDLNNIFFVGDIFDEIVIGDQKYCPENQTSRTKFVMANISQVTNTSVLGIIPNLQKKQDIFIALRTRSNTTSIIPIPDSGEYNFQFAIYVDIIPIKDWIFATEQIIIAVITLILAVGGALLTVICTRKMSKDEMYYPVLTEDYGN